MHMNAPPQSGWYQEAPVMSVMRCVRSGTLRLTKTEERLASFCRETHFSVPKERGNKAQGETLGTGIGNWTSPVRAAQVVQPIDFLPRPFRANGISSPNPGLAPWALLPRPFGAGNDFRDRNWLVSVAKVEIEVRRAGNKLATCGGELRPAQV